LVTQLNENSGIRKLLSKINIEDVIGLLKTVARHTVEEYVMLTKIVIAMAYKRELYSILKNYTEICLDENNKDVNNIYKLLTENVDNLTQKYIIDDKIQPIGEKIDDLWKELCERRTNMGYGIPSKFPRLNDFFTYEKSEVVVVRAQRKIGKSVFMLNEAIHLIRNNIPVMYVDTEMSDLNFIPRLLANLTGIDINNIKSGNYSKSDEELIESAKRWLKSKPFIHIYNPTMDLKELYALTKIKKIEMNLQFLIYDYIKASGENLYTKLADITNYLKNDIAGGLDLAILAGAQENRSGDIGDSFKIEQYASTIISLRPKTEEEIMTDGTECGNYCINVVANRNGENMDENDYIDLVFKKNIAVIEQAKKQHKKENPFE
jgi:replicative DNA helicase